ncbi:hypothetical protein V8C44DRAFT_51539 [Trichoderma aethiopicum]
MASRFLVPSASSAKKYAEKAWKQTPCFDEQRAWLFQFIAFFFLFPLLSYFPLLLLPLRFSSRDRRIRRAARRTRDRGRKCRTGKKKSDDRTRVRSGNQSISRRQFFLYCSLLDLGLLIADQVPQPTCYYP